jgi:dynein heavy chain
MEEANKKYDLVYGIYRDHVNQLKEFSVMSWNKLDAKTLIDSADHFEKMVKRLQSKLTQPESIHPFVKLRETIIGFKDSLPLIEQLKSPAIE